MQNKEEKKVIVRKITGRQDRFLDLMEEMDYGEITRIVIADGEPRRCFNPMKSIKFDNLSTAEILTKKGGG